MKPYLPILSGCKITEQGYAEQVPDHLLAALMFNAARDPNKVIRQQEQRAYDRGGAPAAHQQKKYMMWLWGEGARMSKSYSIVLAKGQPHPNSLMHAPVLDKPMHWFCAVWESESYNIDIRIPAEAGTNTPPIDPVLQDHIVTWGKKSIPAAQEFIHIAMMADDQRNDLFNAMDRTIEDLQQWTSTGSDLLQVLSRGSFTASMIANCMIVQDVVQDIQELNTLPPFEGADLN